MPEPDLALATPRQLDALTWAVVGMTIADTAEAGIWSRWLEEQKDRMSYREADDALSALTRGADARINAEIIASKSRQPTSALAKVLRLPRSRHA